MPRRMTTTKRERARELRREMTPSERVLWEQLRAHRLSGLHFRRQHVIQGFIADFYCDAARLIVEVDGPVHERRRADDMERDKVLEAEGYRILRVTNDEASCHLDTVLEHIKRICLPEL